MNLQVKLRHIILWQREQSFFFPFNITLSSCKIDNIHFVASHHRIRG